MDHDDYVLRDPHEQTSIFRWQCNCCGFVAWAHEFHEVNFTLLTPDLDYDDSAYTVMCPVCFEAETEAILP